MPNELLNFDWSELSDDPDLQQWGVIGDYCARFPQHPVCTLNGGHNPNDNGSAGGDLNRGNGHHPGHSAGGHDDGNLGWYPFS